MQTILFLTLILLLAEVLEALLQQASTPFYILEKLYGYYQKSIFLFFLVQPSTYVIFMIILYTDILNFSMIVLILLKIVDLFYKIELMKELFIEKKRREDLAFMLDYPLSTPLKFIGVLISPPLLFFALI